LTCSANTERWIRVAEAPSDGVSAVHFALMPLPDSTSIAGARTVMEWKALKAQLDSHPTAVLWNQAFEEFHGTRINTRYLGPMRAIQEHLQSDLGEGFAIAALFCSLVEFLESTEQGLKYVHRTADPAKHEYSNSGGLFAAFLKKRAPFDKLVAPSALADDFYKSMRCGLLHEARTKGNWVIWSVSAGGKLIHQDVSGKIIVFRNEFVPALEQYLADYRVRLLADAQTQAAFVRKWEWLCEP
jgi:hypothetical protein